MNKKNLNNLVILVLTLGVFILMTSCGNSFVGTWTGVASDPRGYSSPAVAVFSKAEWALMVPEDDLDVRGAYTAKGNTATIHARGEATTAEISSGTLIASISGLGTVTMTKNNPTGISAGKWVHSSVTDTAPVATYSFNVSKGSTYYIWTNDEYDGDDTKTVDIVFTVFDEKNVYGYGDDHWTRPYMFTASEKGKVTIAVASYYSEPGTFAIAFSTASNRP